MDIKINNAVPIKTYKETTKRLLHLSYPYLTDSDLENVIDYSINKRFINEQCSIYNNYTNQKLDTNLLYMTDYIMRREPIVTTYGVLFKKHADCPNPIMMVIDLFLKKRGIDKDEMFKYPRGSELYEKYNLFQLLDKRDGNAVYGILGLYVSLFYNLHVAPSITSQGRSMVSAAGMQFEMFLANNVKFCSLDEVVMFIDHVITERNERKFIDKDILDKDISTIECFSQIVLTCGYQWVPTEQELEIIWNLICNLNQEDINRLYYKNNLYEFMNNSKLINLFRTILIKMDKPFMSPIDVPDIIKYELNYLTDLLMEYVYYHYQIMDRVDRMDNMIKSVCMISDTDSTIISLDAWYHFGISIIEGMDFNILHVKSNLLKEYEHDELGTFRNPIKFIDNEVDYDFYKDEVFEREKFLNPVDFIPQDNLRYSIINIMSYVLDRIINDYMLRFTKETHSYADDKKCRIVMKNEYLIKRALLLMVKKNYASLLELQEGHIVDKKGELAITGIQALKKSVTPQKTRDTLTRILYEDILKSPEIDQLKIIKHLIIYEKEIEKNIQIGDKSYFKPMRPKSIGSYADPMRQQAIKGCVAWNGIKSDDLDGFDLNEQNPMDLAKTKIDKYSAEIIKDEYPDIYNNIMIFLEKNKEYYKGSIDSIAIPKNVSTPTWLIPLIDISTIVNDNLSGFPIESIGISRRGNMSVNYTNILTL